MFVIVVSTTGDGDPPDNASKFWRRLRKRTLPSNHLANSNYTLLGTYRRDGGRWSFRPYQEI